MEWIGVTCRRTGLAWVWCSSVPLGRTRPCRRIGMHRVTATGACAFRSRCPMAFCAFRRGFPIAMTRQARRHLRVATLGRLVRVTRAPRRKPRFVIPHLVLVRVVDAHRAATAAAVSGQRLLRWRWTRVGRRGHTGNIRSSAAAFKTRKSLPQTAHRHRDAPSMLGRTTDVRGLDAGALTRAPVPRAAAARSRTPRPADRRTRGTGGRR